MLIIDRWVGRLGNNILQVLRSIYLARKTGHDTIKLPNHHFFNETFIEVNKRYADNKTIYGDFFDLKDFNFFPSTKELKEIANLYKHKFIPEKYFRIDEKKLSSCVITAHLRGGDVFKFNPHPDYVQPPFFFIKKYYLKLKV